MDSELFVASGNICLLISSFLTATEDGLLKPQTQSKMLIDFHYMDADLDGHGMRCCTHMASVADWTSDLVLQASSKH